MELLVKEGTSSKRATVLDTPQMMLSNQTTSSLSAELCLMRAFFLYQSRPFTLENLGQIFVMFEGQ